MTSMVSNVNAAIGLLQAVSVAFPAWLIVSQLVLRRTKASDSVEMTVWEEGALHALIISTYGALVLIIQKIYEVFSISDISPLLLKAVVWFRTWTTISGIIIYLIMTREYSLKHQLTVLLSGITLTVIFNWIVGLDMSM